LDSMHAGLETIDISGEYTISSAICRASWPGSNLVEYGEHAPLAASACSWAIAAISTQLLANRATCTALMMCRDTALNSSSFPTDSSVDEVSSGRFALCRAAVVVWHSSVLQEYLQAFQQQQPHVQTYQQHAAHKAAQQMREKAEKAAAAAAHFEQTMAENYLRSVSSLTLDHVHPAVHARSQFAAAASDYTAGVALSCEAHGAAADDEPRVHVYYETSVTPSCTAIVP
jgi:hypothetical protein